jgi:hypothetical protein
MRDEKTPKDPRKDRQQYYPGDIVWNTRSADVTPEQEAAVLKDQEQRRKGTLRKKVTQAVQGRRKKA